MWTLSEEATVNDQILSGVREWSIPKVVISRFDPCPTTLEALRSGVQREVSRAPSSVRRHHIDRTVVESRSFVHIRRDEMAAGAEGLVTRRETELAAKEPLS